METTTELLTAAELAVRLRVRACTVRTWARHGVIPTVRISPKVMRFELQSVIRTIRERGSEGVQHAR